MASMMAMAANHTDTVTQALEPSAIPVGEEWERDNAEDDVLSKRGSDDENRQAPRNLHQCGHRAVELT
jgi:hypothetical protein